VAATVHNAFMLDWARTRRGVPGNVVGVVDVFLARLVRRGISVFIV